ncbi:hypothetical protein MRB53_021190 [Persea americana]|uniref:Uncharacterized protein n=1 Tax=Persea americana TaxID=3435 RepID=A0ACC2L4B9_PERAE|nr:hypothetical protein MRB53_021190 [Persea americana]
MDRKSKKRAAKKSEVDRLSSLPESLLHHILSFLDMKDVIRAGLSSWRLREISTSVPNLHFDICKSDCEEDFVSFVYQTLVLSSAPKIHKFQLRSPCNSDYIPHIDAWIHFAIEKGVRELDLFFLIKHGNDPYELPSSFLKCQTLVSLNLKNCVFKIRRSSLSSPSSSLRLKRLTIDGGHNESIEIEAPNLQFLKIRSGNVGRCSFGDMVFLREAYIDVSYPPGSTSEFISILESSLQNLRHASVLKLSSTCLQVMPIPTFEDLHSYFFKTKHLILRTRVQKYEIPGIANVLWSSPDLENLVIDLVPSDCICDKECNNKYDFDEREYWESLRATFRCLVHQLKTIKITGFMGGDSLDPGIKGTSFHVKDEQIKLVKFLLKNAMVLKKMTVHVSRPKFVREIQWLEKMLRVTQTLLAFPRASSHAEVLFQNE